MSMDIKNLTQTQPRTAGEGRSVAENAGVRTGGAAPGKDGGGGGDRVTLTDTARRLSELTSTVSEQPAVDTQRVEQIRQAIQDGSYRVNPERIAERLIEMEKGR
jgi:negative regulator of flagellin synthesis FlgM